MPFYLLFWMSSRNIAPIFSNKYMFFSSYGFSVEPYSKMPNIACQHPLLFIGHGKIRKDLGPPWVTFVKFYPVSHKFPKPIKRIKKKSNNKVGEVMFYSLRKWKQYLTEGQLTCSASIMTGSFNCYRTVLKKSCCAVVHLIR